MFKRITLAKQKDVNWLSALNLFRNLIVDVKTTSATLAAIDKGQKFFPHFDALFQASEHEMVVVIACVF